jgi:type I restriction enzyme M protein
MDFSDFRSDLDTKEHKERFFAGVPNVPKKAREKMAIYQLFLQHIIYSLKSGGKAAVVVPTGFITAQSGIDKSIRRHLVGHLGRNVLCRWPLLASQYSPVRHDL